MSINWFGYKLLGEVHRDGIREGRVVFAQAHRRFNKRGCASQGIGVGQIGGRHLFFVGSEYGRAHVCVAFVWLVGGFHG